MYTMSTSTDSKYVLLIVSTDLVCPSRYLLTKLDCTVNAFNIMEQKTGMEVKRLCESKVVETSHKQHLSDKCPTSTKERNVL